LALLVICPIEEDDGRLCFRWRQYVGRYRYICLWTTYWRQFKSDYHQTSSVIPFLGHRGRGD